MWLSAEQPEQGDGVAVAFTAVALQGDDTTTIADATAPDHAPPATPAATDLFFQSDAAASLTPPPPMPPNLPAPAAGTQAPGGFGPQAPLVTSGGGQAQGGGAGTGDSTAALNQQLMQDMAALDASVAASQAAASAQQAAAGPASTQAPSQQTASASVTSTVPTDTSATAAPGATATEQPSQPASPFAATALSTASVSPASLGSQALAFESNQGQAASGQFLAHGAGYGLALSPNSAALTLAAPAAVAAPQVLDNGQVAAPGPQVLSMSLLGANPQAPGQALGQLPGVVNYYLGNDPAQWITGVSTYAQVQFQGVYANTDVLYSGTTQGQLEYTFALHPGADPSAIRLGFSGVSGMQLDAQGNLVLHTAGGDVVQHAPVAYQLDASGNAVPVTSSFMLNADGSVGFQVGSYDPSQDLFIDPVLSYSSYWGGSGADQANAVAADPTGNACYAGQTPDLTYSSSTDAFVVKVNPAGQKVFTDYFGGSGSSPWTASGNGIATDSSGNPVLVGITTAASFPTTMMAYQRTFAGTQDGFVLKLSSTGMLSWSTFLGSGGSQSLQGVAVDTSGNVYVTGWTNSSSYPTLHAAQSSYGGGTSDGVVTELSSMGSALVYSSFFGGSGADQGNAIAVGASGKAYVVGTTSSSNLPVSSGAWQTTEQGTTAAFVAAFNSGGSQAYATYVSGSSGSTAGNAVVVDASGDAYLAGSTSSPNFVTTTGAFQTALGGGTDAFVTEVNPSGSAPVFSTYVGGNQTDSATGIALTPGGQIAVVGTTSSSNFPVRGNSQALAGSSDLFVTELLAGGSGLYYSALYGGSNTDQATGVAAANMAVGSNVLGPVLKGPNP